MRGFSRNREVVQQKSVTIEHEIFQIIALPKIELTVGFTVRKCRNTLKIS